MTEEEKWEAAKAVIAANIANPKLGTEPNPEEPNYVIVTIKDKLWRIARISKFVVNGILPSWATHGWWLDGFAQKGNKNSSLNDLAFEWSNLDRVGWILDLSMLTDSNYLGLDLLIFGEV